MTYDIPKCRILAKIASYAAELLCDTKVPRPFGQLGLAIASPSRQLGLAIASPIRKLGLAIASPFGKIGLESRVHSGSLDW